jgi:hypothetical protein
LCEWQRPLMILASATIWLCTKGFWMGVSQLSQSSPKTCERQSYITILATVFGDGLEHRITELEHPFLWAMMLLLSSAEPNVLCLMLLPLTYSQIQWN